MNASAQNTPQAQTNNFVTPHVQPSFYAMEPEAIYDICVESLRRYTLNAGFTEVVIGLSGGIDSALTAVMCADAFGADKVHAVLLPGPYSSEHSITDAMAEVQTLGLDARLLSINEPYEAFAQLLAPECDGALAGMASQNTQARCRMVVLMALSNHHGWLMVNTSNKSEAMMGYSTLYGDTAGAFAPIGGIYKSTVYEVARARNERARAQGLPEPIPANVLRKAPSAELAPGQEDEASLGISYHMLDPVLISHFEQGLSAESVAERVGLEQAFVKDIIARAESFAFKRAVEPPFPEEQFYQ